MEKIVVVKREPVDDAGKVSNPVPGQPVAPTAPRGDTTVKSPVILIQSTNDGAQQTQSPKPLQKQQPQKQVQAKQQHPGPHQSITVSSGPTIQAVSPLRGVSSIAQSTPVVLCRSPLKLTPVQAQRLVSSTGKTQDQGKTVNNTNFTVYHVQPLTTANPKNALAPKQGMSPSKVVPIQLQKLVPISSSGVAKAPVTMATQATAVLAPSATTVRHIAPKVNITPVLAGQAVSIATTRLQNVATAQQLAPKPVQPSGTTAQAQIQPQRVLVPAISSSVPQLQGATSNLQFPHGVISGGVVYLPQQALNAGAFPIAVPLQTSTITTSANQVSAASVNGTTVETSPPTRPRKPCNCTKSQCLKLYCDCFANGEFCSNCNCVTCFNNMEHERERSKAIKACLERNPQAFHPKIGKGKAGESERRHNKGCHCKRSGCLKNYCECYEAKILCTSLCKCTGCKNFEESPERKTLMHLADAAEVRVKQQNAAKTILESQIEDLPTRPMLNSGEKLPFSFVTDDIVQATCQCLLAQAVEAEKAGKTAAVTEKILLEEFGRCLLRIIHTANKTKGE